MRKTRCCTLVASILTLLLTAPPSAWGWGNEGHEAVACVAWQRLTQSTKDKVFALLAQVPSRTNAAGTETIPGFKQWQQNMPAGLTEDQQHMYIFMRAATWPDSIKHKFLHDSDTPPANQSVAASNIGFTDPDSHGYWHFINTAFGTPASPRSAPPSVPKNCWKKEPGQQPAPPTPVKALPAAPTPNVATEITLLSTALASSEASPLKSYDMIWLEHLIGDIHQPLHSSARFVGGIDDLGGNCVAISVPANLRENFASSNPKAKPPSELHAFWDDLPGVGEQMDTQKAADYAATLAPADDRQAAISDPAAWAKESFDLAVHDAYAGPIGPALGSPKAYVITGDYYNKAAADAKIRVALAGARLANVLTQNLH